MAESFFYMFVSLHVRFIQCVLAHINSETVASVADIEAFVEVCGLAH